MLAALVFAMLVPQESRSNVLISPAPVAAAEQVSWEPVPLPRATAARHVTAKALQFGGAHVVGAGGALAGGAIALVPGLLLLSMDSGNVGVGVLLCGAVGGYSLGAAFAIHASALEVTGVRGSLEMTALGIGAAIVLTGAVLATVTPPEDWVIAAAVLVPPAAGILVFELTKEGRPVRKPVPRGLGTLLMAAGLTAAGHAATQLTANEAPVSRILVPLLQVRW